jgi:hypothetical protein
VRVRLIFALAALVFFATPVALRAVGVTARAFENRRLADPPRVSQGFDAFPQATRFFVDRMPLREQAVRANTWVSRSIFATTPTYARRQTDASAGALPFGGPKPEPAKPAGAATTQPPPGERAIDGRDGWIFLDGELLRACARFIPEATAMDRWLTMVRTIRRSGRRVVLVIPPDKSTIYPEKIGGKNPAADCMAKSRAEAWHAMESTGDPDVVPLRRPLLARKRAGSEVLYKRKDTHWNGVGAEVFVRETLRALHAGVQVTPGEFRPAKEVYRGDLAGLLGITEEDTTPTRKLVRAPGAPVVRGRTLFLYDSFGIAAIDHLRPYFQDLDPYLWVGSTAPERIRRIAAARTVVLESVEREMDWRASDQGYVTPAFLAQLKQGLAG